MNTKLLISLFFFSLSAWAGTTNLKFNLRGDSALRYLISTEGDSVYDIASLSGSIDATITTPTASVSPCPLPLAFSITHSKISASAMQATLTLPSGETYSYNNPFHESVLTALDQTVSNIGLKITGMDLIINKGVLTEDGSSATSGLNRTTDYASSNHTYSYSGLGLLAFSHIKSTKTCNYELSISMQKNKLLWSTPYPISLDFNHNIYAEAVLPY